MLDRLATYKEKTEALKAKIKSAMNYPIAVLVIAGIVTGILLVKVVPQFEVVFSGFGADLPAFTQMVVDASEFMQAWWLIILLIIEVFTPSINRCINDPRPLESVGETLAQDPCHWRTHR